MTGSLTLTPAGNDPKKVSSSDDLTIEADNDATGDGDLIFKTGGVERARIDADGVGTGLFGDSQPRVTVYGHSYAEGAGASRGALAYWGHGWVEVMARILNARVDNRAISGSNITSSASPALSALILQRLPKQVGPPFNSPVEAAAIYSAINDMTAAATIAEPTILSDYMYAFCLRLRAIASAPSTDATFAYAQGAGASGWTTSGSGFSMGTVTGAQSNGNIWTLTLPATFPGGDLYVLGIRQSASGATHSVTVDGSAYGTWDTRGATQSVYRPSIFKISGLAAGAHTIVGTVSNLLGTEFIQGWLLDGSDAPAVAYAGANRAPAYPGGGAHTIVDADIATINAALATVADHFADGRVKYVDVDALLAKNTAYFDTVGYNGAANVHPNNNGHALIGVAFAAALSSVLQTDAGKGKTLALPGDYLSWPRLLNSADPMDKPRIGLATLGGAGTATITTRALTSESLVFLTARTATGAIQVSAQTASSASIAGTFTITSAAGAGDSGKTVNWMVVDYVQ